ncbi:MAG: acyl carrier protein [Candidatus Saccharibacteria bacterium]|nr:acyl carrier protein [Candidatus Saccharibacteria bacterium]
MEEIKKTVISAIAEVLEIDEGEIKTDMSLSADLGAESLDLVDLVALLEEKFETEIADEDLSSIQTVQDIIDYINSHKDA